MILNKKELNYIIGKTCEDLATTGFRDSELFNLVSELKIKLSDELEGKQCSHPFALVVTRCHGEINHCLKCGKNL